MSVNFFFLNPTPLNPTPATCHKRKRKLRCNFWNAALQKVALQHWLFCSAEVILTKSGAAASEKLHCNFGKAALQESGAFLPLSCGFQAPTFRHPRLGPADRIDLKVFRGQFRSADMPKALNKSQGQKHSGKNRCLFLGSQHPSTNVKNLCNFEPQIWLEIITSRDAKTSCFKGSQTSCIEKNSGFFFAKFGRKRLHHVMDACC